MSFLPTQISVPSARRASTPWPSQTAVTVTVISGVIDGDFVSCLVHVCRNSG
jgi:hypothetical protein